MIIHVPPQLAANLQAWAAEAGYADAETYAIELLSRQLSDSLAKPLTPEEKSQADLLLRRSCEGGSPAEMTADDWRLLRRYVSDPRHVSRMPETPEELDAMVDEAMKPGKVSPWQNSNFDHLSEWLEAFIEANHRDASHE